MLIVRRSVLTALFLAIAVCKSVSAQRIVGPGADAWTLPAGVVRFEVAPRLFGARERFSASGRESIAAPFAGGLDASRLASLVALEEGIAALTPNTPFQATLGTARINAAITAAVIPISIQAGLTNRITLHATAPFFTGKHDVQFGIDPANATAGTNPGLTNPTARLNNEAIVGGLASAAENLEILANDCAANAEADPRCAQIVAELNAVRALVERARTYSELLGRTYGGNPAAAPAPFVPFIGTAAHDAVVAQLASLRSEFDRYAMTSVNEGAAPSGAATPLTAAEFNAFLADSTNGYALAPVARRYHQGFGDIDLGVNFRLFDGIGANPWLTDTTVRRGIRQTFGFTYRLGTGTPSNADDPFLLPTGDGQDDLEFMSATDILPSRRVWGSVIVRYTKQQPLDRITRIPDATGSPFIQLDRRRMASTELGDRLQIEALPRFVVTDYLAFGLQYRFMSQAAGSIDEVAPFTDAIPLTSSVPSMTAHEVGLGFTWSSIAAHRRGRARLPFEIQYDHTMVVAGSGGAIRFSADRILVRAYASFW